ncbi:MAG TPA: hypothetical protein VNY05_02270 [Candidatus Acidoferrales bacterium]|nr:hypothetical protein [Candidatus Acidoferrales bacterium]
MDNQAFEHLERTLRSDGVEAAFDLLIREAREALDCRVLFGARIMQARHRLGLPLIETEPVLNLAADQRLTYETAFREAAREAGELLLAGGDIAGAWPYFKAIGEPGTVAAAIENVNGGDHLDRVIEIAFQEGVNPRKGFELILEHHGICRAITWFGSNRDYDSRRKSLRLLVETLYGQIASAIKETIASAEGAAPEANGLAELMAGRAWLFEGNSSYTDSTHLTSVLRFTPELEDAETLRMALEMAEYGQCLAPMFHFRGDSPFEDPYLDHAVYLRALLGRDVDAAIAHFRQKATPSAEFPLDTAPAEVLIELLVRLERYAEAIQASVDCLPEASGAPLSCPSVLQLCQMAGDYEGLRRLAREREDLLGFAAGLIQS